MDNWQHSSTAERLIVREGLVYRERRPNDPVDGIIHFADLVDKDIERNNYQVVIDSGLHCWPNPKVLLRMIDRYDVLDECVRSGFIDHEIHINTQLDTDALYDMFDFTKSGKLVVKMGNVHRGEGKFLIENVEQFPAVTSRFSIESYFEGISVRSLIIGGDTFGIRVENDRSWIKNSAGADIDDYELSKELIEHSRNVAYNFELDVAGVDYIVEKDGNFKLLEINFCPGVSGSDRIEECAKEFFKKKMREIEERSRKK